ncbi:MAG TPA: hypothetical protein VFJ06_00200 [Halococcus sp.]|nr:hypothetical protein [Halococcus sp.]
MQRRTAAIYVVFFVVVAIVAFSLTTVAEEPSVSVEGQGFSHGDTIRAGGTQWTVNVSDGSGQLSTVNESAQFTAALANGSAVVFQKGMYRPASNGSGGGAGTASPSGATTSGAVGTSVPTAGGGGSSPGTRFLVVIEDTSAGNASNITSFTLRQQFDIGARLRADPSVADTTLTAANGTEYVRYRNGSTQPLDAYLPTPKTRTISVGDSFSYQTNSTTVARVNTSAATLAWQGELTRTKELEEGVNVTLGGTTYVSHFSQPSSVVLSQNVSGYQAEMEDVEHFHNRILGLWGVVIISLAAVILIVGLAYMPARD